MYIIALFMTFAMAIVGVGGLELLLTYEHGAAQRNAGRLADQYMAQAEQDYANYVGTYIQNNTASNGAITTCQTGQTSGCLAARSVSNAALCGTVGYQNAVSGGVAHTCGFKASYTVTTSGSTGNGTGSGESSANVNASAQENRLSAVLQMTVANASGMVLAKRTRTFIVRTYPVAPYATVVASTDTQDVYQAANSTHSNIAEGDVAGCDPTTGCGTDTRISSYAACEQSGSSTLQQMQQSWCQHQNTSSSYYSASATVPSISATPVSTTVFQNSSWSSTNASSGSGN